MTMNIEPVKCKYCSGNNMKRYGHYNGEQLWWCDDCKRKQSSKDTLFKMRYPSNQIATALRLYYEGLSLDAIQEEFQHQFGSHVATSTVYEWIQEFTNEAISKANEFDPIIGDKWIADETAIVVRGKLQKGKRPDRHYWLFDIIDSQTRFLLATHITATRSISDVQMVMNQAAKRAGKLPSEIVTDKMPSYPDGINYAFHGQAKHIQSGPFDESDNTNLIERFHGTLKDRVKVLRGFKSIDTAKQLLDGWLVYYNFLRPHESLDRKSPAEHMNIKVPFTSWLDVIKNTQERVIKPEIQPTVIPLTRMFESDPELRREYERAYYRKHHIPKYKQRSTKRTLSSIVIAPRRTK